MTSTIHQELIAQIDLMIRARYPLIYLVTQEEEPIEEILIAVCKQIQPQRLLRYWDIVRGWSDTSNDQGAVMAALARIAQQGMGRESILFVLRDLHPYLNTPVTENHLPIVRELRNLAKELKRSRSSIILSSYSFVMPPELQEEVSVVYFPLPDTKEISFLIRQVVAPDKLKLAGLGWEQLVKASQGLSRTRIQRVLARSLADKQQIDETDIDRILEEKRQAIRQTEFLEFYAGKDSLKGVGGLDNLKQWVRIRRDAFTEEARSYGIPNPKGLLLVGIQGTGKSLSAKTIAYEWRLPLLRLDIGRLFGSYIGESEERVRQMIQLAEAVAPCILWIDEIDKGFGNVTSGNDSDSGTSRRVFGSIITWMQEKQSAVFIVATANDVKVLPAELLRKGRFDEIFFLSLPTESERQEIFRVHLQRLRPNRIREFDLAVLAKKSIDFSGAEIEQVLMDAMHIAFGKGTIAHRQDFKTEDVLQAIGETVPLAKIAYDQITMLKRWAIQAGARLASNDPVLHAELQKFQLKDTEYY